jgi:DNA-binding MarR family transcriptional regulator
MNQKQIGIILIIMGVLLSTFVYVAKVREDGMISLMIQQQGGSCYLADGTCLHDNRDWSLYIAGWAFSFATIIFGLYLIFFDKTQQMLAEHQVKVSAALGEAAKKTGKEEKFKAFLAGFNEDERKAIGAIHEQDGILQSTLRYRTGMSKTALSLMLKSLEERDIISRKESGKTNEVFLRKKF